MTNEVRFATTQKEYDELKTDFDVAISGAKKFCERIHVTGPRNVRAYAGTYVVALNGSFVYAKRGSFVDAHPGSTVYAEEDSTIRVWHGSNVIFYGRCTIDAPSGSSIKFAH